MWTSDDLDDLTYDQEVDGVLARKQLDRVVLTRGAWATVLFLYVQLDRATGDHGAPKVAVVRFQRSRGGWRKHAAFTLATADDARALADVLARWGPRLAADDTDDDDADARTDGDELGTEG
jgi:hypothetical protein